MSGLKRVETMSGKENQKIIGDGDQVSRMLKTLTFTDLLFYLGRREPFD